MFIDYIIFFKFFILCLAIVILLFGISFFFVYQIIDIEKISSYECGFNPFTDSRMKFEIRFYLIGILFIIFDLEIIFLFPWLFIVMQGLSWENGLYMFIFLLILILGFIYELIKGAIDWE